MLAGISARPRQFHPDEFRRKVSGMRQPFRRSGACWYPAGRGHHAGRPKSFLRLQFGRPRHHGKRFQSFRNLVRAAFSVRIAVVYRLENLFPAQIFPDGDKFHFRRNNAPPGVITLCHRRFPRGTQGVLLPLILFHIPAGPYPGGTQGGSPFSAVPSYAASPRGRSNRTRAPGH